ncbi:MAG: Brp/Blh family beta-carotene 15,15'-dioxygenase, partial [Desulfobacterales bacterium]
MNHLNSYEKVTAWHSLTFFGITIATILISGTGMLDSIGRQLVLLAVLLPFAGIPHGALDYKVAQDTLEHKMGKLWSVSFLTGYVILMATVLLAWQINPSGSLAVFLCITALHFGTGDTLTTLGTPTTIRIADAIGRGGTVLTFPALFFPEDVALLFSYLIAENDARLFTGFLGLMAPLTVLALLSSIGWYIIQFLRYRDNIHLSRMLELIALMAAFSFLPALLAFTIYFSFLHSVRHLLYLAACINADDLTGSLRFTLT